MHPTFGRGIVRRREGRGDGAKAWVNFDRGGIKLLVLKFANLRSIADWRASVKILPTRRLRLTVHADCGPPTLPRFMKATSISRFDYCPP